MSNIDAHQHFWRYDPAEYGWIDDSMARLRRNFLPADIKNEMTRAGIDACIAVQVRQSLEETRWLLELADANPFIVGVIGWVDLQADNLRDQLEGFGPGSKLVGIRHIVQAEGDDRFLLRPSFCRGVSVLQDLNLPYDILIYPRYLGVAAEFVSRFKQQRFVVDHLAKPDIRGGELRMWERGIRALAEFPHVFCKVSGLITEADWTCWTPEQLRPYLDVVFDAFGAHRLIAGSDWPVCTVAADYSRTMSVLTHYLSERPESERVAVLGANAERCWNLNVDGRPYRRLSETGEMV
jgi:L-fuconolactonase